MIQSNKMIYQPPKYHSNSFTHFLQLHSSINNTNSPLSNVNRSTEDSHLNDEHTKLEIHDNNSNASNTSLEVVSNDSVGKSFTIAAILGLKKSSVNHLRQNSELDEVGPGLNDYGSEFPSLINLTAHSKLFQKFDNDNRHNYMLSPAQQPAEHPQMPIEQCAGMYDNNTTSNSSYQEHLHKHSLGAEFNANYSRNADDPSMNPQNNPALRNHLQQHVNNNLLNKAFNRDRNRMDHFASKSKSSMSLKNKRVRTIFTPEQLERLEAEFERQQYMVGPERLYLAHTLQLTEAQVKVWFQNRRIKWRKHHLEITQQHLAIARQRQIPVPVPSTSRNMSEESAQSDGQIVSDGDE